MHTLSDSQGPMAGTSADFSYPRFIRTAFSDHRDKYFEITDPSINDLSDFTDNPFLSRSGERLDRDRFAARLRILAECYPGFFSEVFLALFNL